MLRGGGRAGIPRHADSARQFQMHRAPVQRQRQDGGVVQFHAAEQERALVIEHAVFDLGTAQAEQPV